MALDLEIAGPVRELTPDEIPERTVPALKTLRESHHAVARLLARGLPDIQVAAQTGYSLGRLSQLRKDQSFRELMAFYARTADEVARQVEEKFLLVAEDARQILHEKILDSEVTLEEALDVFKVMADRAGYAPVQRSINKNMNLNIGARLDAARAKKDAA